MENSFIHGFRDMEEAGAILVRVRFSDGRAEVLIRDNGNGIAPDKVRQLNETRFSQSENGADHAGHTTGLGLGNVYERLRYFYDREDVMSVRSGAGQFTEMQVNLYY